MTAETVRCWLVAREFYDEDLVTLVYATPDGSQQVRQQRSSALLMKGQVTAAIDVEPERLESVADEQDRYAREAARMADQHDPDDEV
mgnify:CR=1 FL=1